MKDVVSSDLSGSPEQAPNFEGWRKTMAPVAVTIVWAYDTSAILDDYHDSQEGTLSAGQLIKFSQVIEESSDHLLCDLDDPGFVERECLAPGRVLRYRPWCFATRLQVVMARHDYEASTAEARRPSWLHRLMRKIH